MAPVIGIRRPLQNAADIRIYSLHFIIFTAVRDELPRHDHLRDVLEEPCIDVIPVQLLIFGDKPGIAQCRPETFVEDLLRNRIFLDMDCDQIFCDLLA